MKFSSNAVAMVMLAFPGSSVVHAEDFDDCVWPSKRKWVKALEKDLKKIARKHFVTVDDKDIEEVQKDLKLMKKKLKSMVKGKDTCSVDYCDNLITDNIVSKAGAPVWGGHVIENAFDGKLGTYFDAASQGSKVEVCFEKPVDISCIMLHSRIPVQIHANRTKNGVWKCDDNEVIGTTNSVLKDVWNSMHFESFRCTCISFTFSSSGDYGSVAEIKIGGSL